METGYHETGLSEEAKDLHRALKSLMEELEAIDWYQQRIDVSSDESLRSVLAHNRDEEMEHAAMTLEWLRRKLPSFEKELRKHLFSEGSIAEGEGTRRPGAPAADLGIGSMKSVKRRGG